MNEKTAVQGTVEQTIRLVNGELYDLCRDENARLRKALERIRWETSCDGAGPILNKIQRIVDDAIGTEPSTGEPEIANVAQSLRQGRR